jgi:hypothetical protein
MSRKIIIYNSFTHDANPHATLLKNQLAEVNKELLTCRANDKKTLLNERRLLQRKLRAQDVDLKKQIEELEREIQDMIQLGISPRERVKLETERKLLLLKLSRGQKDGMGSPEEVAYGVGYGSDFKDNPYSDPAQAKAWERGKQDGIVAKKFRKNSYMGGVRGQKFVPPRARDSQFKPGDKVKVKGWEGKSYTGSDVYTIRKESDAGGAYFLIDARGNPASMTAIPENLLTKSSTSRDFRSERGYVGKIVNAANGKLLAKSEPMISEKSAQRWAAEQAPKFRTMRTKQEFEMVFYDPDRIAADKL